MLGDEVTLRGREHMIEDLPWGVYILLIAYREDGPNEGIHETGAAVAKSWMVFSFGRIATVRVCGKRLLASEVHYVVGKAVFSRSRTRSVFKPACIAVGLVASRVLSKTRRCQGRGIGNT